MQKQDLPYDHPEGASPPFFIIAPIVLFQDFSKFKRIIAFSQFHKDERMLPILSLLKDEIQQCIHMDAGCIQERYRAIFL